MERPLVPGHMGLHPVWSRTVCNPGPSFSLWPHLEQEVPGTPLCCRLGLCNKCGPVSLKQDSVGFGEKHRYQEQEDGFSSFNWEQE